jgi:hypothetical protein
MSIQKTKISKNPPNRVINTTKKSIYPYSDSILPANLKIKCTQVKKIKETWKYAEIRK